MMTHEGRGTSHHVGTPTSEEGASQAEEGRIPHSFAPPLAYENWAECARFTVLWTFFCLWRCGWRLVWLTDGAVVI